MPVMNTEQPLIAAVKKKPGPAAAGMLSLMIRLENHGKKYMGVPRAVLSMVTSSRAPRSFWVRITKPMRLVMGSPRAFMSVTVQSPAAGTMPSCAWMLTDCMKLSGVGRKLARTPCRAIFSGSLSRTSEASLRILILSCAATSLRMVTLRTPTQARVPPMGLFTLSRLRTSQAARASPMNFA